MTEVRAGVGTPAECPAAPPRATGGPVDPVPDACIEAAARAILETRCVWRPTLDPVARELAVAEARAAYDAIKAHEPNGHQWETVVPAGGGAEYVQCVACGHTGWVV